MKVGHLKIGMRTIKTAICACLAILLANFFHLEYAVSAGVIAILSVTNTQKSTFKIGFMRIVGLSIATILSFLLFSFLGFSAISFGIFLLFFIPISNVLRLNDGIVVNSVLVTHYLLFQHFSAEIIQNEFSLMGIGVGIALLSNSYMPNFQKDLEENMAYLEGEFKEISAHLASFLNGEISDSPLSNRCQTLLDFCGKSIQLARKYDDNSVFRHNTFYTRYFQMRRTQILLLTDIVKKMNALTVDKEHAQKISEIFETLSMTYETHNDGNLLLKQIQETYQDYRDKRLPTTREEFENRAGLFQVLQLLEFLVKEKVAFSIEWLHENNRGSSFY